MNSVTQGVIALTLGLLLFSEPLLGAEALPVVIEIEPNDEPLQGVTFTAPAMLSGAMPTANDQDAYRWQLSDADAQQLWTLTLTGMPEALTGVSLIRVTPDATGKAVAARQGLFSFGIRNGSRPVTHRNLLLPPGETIVGIFGAGQSKGGFRPPGIGASTLVDETLGPDDDSAPPLPPAYRLSLEPGDAVTFANRPAHATLETALPLRIQSTVGDIASGTTWYRLKVPQGQALQRYTINGGIELTRRLNARLLDSNGGVVSKVTSGRAGHIRLPNLALQPGAYDLELTDPSNLQDAGHAARWVRWAAVGEVAEGEEREPNTNWARANQVDITQTLAASMDQPGDQDFFEFRLTEVQAESPWQLVLNSDELTKVTLCLLNASGTSRQCRNGKPPLVFEHLLLNGGLHGVLVERSPTAGTYSVQLQQAKPLARNSEQEPNDKPQDASVFGKRRIIKGAISAQDTDQFLLLTTEQPQLWRLQAVGSGLRDLRYHPQHSAAGQSVRAAANSRRLRLDNLFLLPGRHRFSLTANADSNYVLRALPLGPPSPFVEREPNNDRTTAHGLALNEKAVALLTEPTDSDYFRWYLAAPQAVRLNLKPAPDAGYRASLYHDGGRVKEFVLPVGTGLAETLWLDPGDYYFSVSSTPTSAAEYEVQVDQLAFPEYVSDVEPNDNANTASTWPTSWNFAGGLGVSRAGVDWYRLPPRTKPLTLQLPKLDGARMQFVDAKRKAIAKAETDAQGNTSINLPAAVEGYLYLSGKGPYAFDIQAADVTPAPMPGELPIELSLSSSAPDIAAYSDWQQQLASTLTLHSKAKQPLTVTLAGDTTDARWQLSIAQTQVTLAPDVPLKVPLGVSIEPDAWPDLPVQLRVTATDKQSRTAGVQQALRAKRRAVDLSPSQPTPVPIALRGHINVASVARGAQWQSDAKKFAYLNDGILALGRFFSSKRDSATGPAVDMPVVALAADDAVQVTGFSLHPFGLQDGQPAQRNARRFAVALSVDGEQFTTVLEDNLTGHTREQFFALPQPVSARFARLHLLDSKDPYVITLGEWKVLADPRSLAPANQQVNIADPNIGGHVTSMEPPLPNYGYVKPMLINGDAPANTRMRKAFDAHWVIGFHHNRAARIDRLTWSNPDSGNLFKTAHVYVSTYSPLGPWTSLGEWKVDGREQSFDLAEPVWARFVKFDVLDAQPSEYMRLPDQIRIFEAPDVHGSILGEWGYDNHRGPFELAQPPLMVSEAESAPAHSKRTGAQSLTPQKPREGVVQLGVYDNWYLASVPQGSNTLTLTLSGSPTVRTQLELLDIENNAIDLKLVETLPDRVVFAAVVETGDYFVKVSEAPRSVIFTWDTSGSTAAVRPIIRQAVLNYVQDITPGMDEARMLPFGGDFLSRRWLDQPYLLQTVFNDYNGAGNSSNAMGALVTASTALKKRPGQRVIVLITDAATPDDPRLWTALAEVRPRIIALGVSSKGAFSSKPLRERDLMQDWAMAGGGYYEYIENVGSMERAFDRASSKIRQPAPYKLAMSTRFEPDPEPGFLQVVNAESGTPGAIQLPPRAIEIVLDASGSMLQRLQGKRRYQIARETLTELVDKHLPDEAQFALRVFGHEEPGTCRTDLVIPPAPLNRSAVKQKLKSIVPKNLAKTPIGASLQAVAADLAKVEGEKVVLLITDGEETCGGDAEAAIEKLASAGIDAVVNIVGFAVDDPELAATFDRWARAGGGNYRSAEDEMALRESVQALTSQAFEVLDEKGRIVAQGMSGDEPIELAPGEYQIRFDLAHAQKVKVQSEKTKTVTFLR